MPPLSPPLALVGGPFCGGSVVPVGPYCYVIGSVRALPGASAGTPGIITVSRASAQPIVGVTEQSVYAQRAHPWPHYRFMSELETP